MFEECDLIVYKRRGVVVVVDQVVPEAVGFVFAISQLKKMNQRLFQQKKKRKHKTQNENQILLQLEEQKKENIEKEKADV